MPEHIHETTQGLRALVGAAAVEQAEQLVPWVLDIQDSADEGAWLGAVADGRILHCAVALGVNDDNLVDEVASGCDCSQPSPCSHALAILLAVEVEACWSQQTSPDVMPWQAAFSRFGENGDHEAADIEPQVALQFDVERLPSGTVSRIALRPVQRSHTGKWVRSGISWRDLSYYRHPTGGPQHRRHVRMLRDIWALWQQNSGSTYYYSPHGLPSLSEFRGRLIWDLLAEAHAGGLPLVGTGRTEPPVTLHGAADVRVLIGRTDDGALQLRPTLEVAGAPVSPQRVLWCGEDPATGVVWWDESDSPRAGVALHLAPAPTGIDSAVRALLLHDTVTVPAADEAVFFGTYYPRLLGTVEMVAPDGAVTLPQVTPPRLHLAVHRLPRHGVRLAWEWRYGLGERVTAAALYGSGASVPRDRNAEAEVLSRVVTAVRSLTTPGLSPADLLEADGRLRQKARLDGLATAGALQQLLPLLEADDEVDVSVELDPELDAENLPVYAEADETPRVTFEAAEEDLQRDWFDLAVSVRVGEEDIAFADLFRALAADEDFLLLPSGTYLRLEQEQFADLRGLIAESRALHDAPEGVLRLTRFQPDAWAELTRLGVVSEQADTWRRTVQAFWDPVDGGVAEVPASLRADLRPYQRDGFGWLSALYDRGLGGILADDMGLGKTLQTLSLIAWAHESDPGAGPVLVVAPTSVVHNWVLECRRFAPHLRCAAVQETESRRGQPLKEIAEDIDVVITSYTLLRLEYDDYAAVTWRAMFLDEAQQVKNRTSQGYRCVRQLPVPVKYAITGTPLENNLSELWALLSIAAPGLFPDPRRFEEFYRKPIERSRDAERLAQLRRRITPLMLRRTKDEVAADLPEKQEQTLELELHPQHRRVYATFLQRERQKVLGLLGDLQKNRITIFRSLTLLRMASLHAGLVDPSAAGVPSAKLDALLEMVQDVAAEGHRVLVFSSFTRFLGMARERLRAAGVRHCYLTGQTRNRDGVLEDWKEGSAPVFLISLKAGGFGLNLTEADYCIILDPWWNPATEAQAVDRAHRIGQTRTVMVYRMVSADTIENKVMALKASKAELARSVLDDGDFASSVLGEAEIRALLGDESDAEGDGVVT